MTWLLYTLQVFNYILSDTEEPIQQSVVSDQCMTIVGEPSLVFIQELNSVMISYQAQKIPLKKPESCPSEEASEAPADPQTLSRWPSTSGSKLRRYHSRNLRGVLQKEPVRLQLTLRPRRDGLPPVVPSSEDTTQEN